MPKYESFDPILNALFVTPPFRRLRAIIENERDIVTRNGIHRLVSQKIKKQLMETGVGQAWQQSLPPEMRQRKKKSNGPESE